MTILKFKKDENFIYTTSNHQYAILHNCFKVSGKKDTILNKRFASLYLKNDYRVLSGETLEINDPAYFTTLGLTNVTGLLEPVYNEKGIIDGISGSLKVQTILNDRPLHDALSILSTVNISSIIIYKKYPLFFNKSLILLTKKEVEITLNLILGRSLSQISESMIISKKTVEHYISNLKNKLFLNAKSDIISKVIQGGLFQWI